MTGTRSLWLSDWRSRRRPPTGNPLLRFGVARPALNRRVGTSAVDHLQDAPEQLAGTATSATWNMIDQPCRAILAPLFTSRSRSLVMQDERCSALKIQLQT